METKIAILTHIAAIETAKKDLNIGFQEKKPLFFTAN
jgi:hypothetical protein